MKYARVYVTHSGEVKADWARPTRVDALDVIEEAAIWLVVIGDDGAIAGFERWEREWRQRAVWPPAPEDEGQRLAGPPAGARGLAEVLDDAVAKARQDRKGQA